MFDPDRDIPRAYTVYGIPHKIASTLGVEWALEQAAKLKAPISLYAPGKQNLRDVKTDHPAVHALMLRGVPVRTWRDHHAGRGVVIALWPDEKHLLEADESSATSALVSVTWAANATLGWAQAKNAVPLGGQAAEATTGAVNLDPVIAEAVDSLGVIVGQHKTVDQRYRATIAKGLSVLLRAGYPLDPAALHTHAIGHGWRASNADHLRTIAERVNAGRLIQGMKTAPLGDGVLDHWRERAASLGENEG